MIRELHHLVFVLMMAWDLSLSSYVGNVWSFECHLQPVGNLTCRFGWCESINGENQLLVRWTDWVWEITDWVQMKESWRYIWVSKMNIWTLDAKQSNSWIYEKTPRVWPGFQPVTNKLCQILARPTRVLAGYHLTMTSALDYKFTSLYSHSLSLSLTFSLALKSSSRCQVWGVGVIPGVFGVEVCKRTFLCSELRGF